MRTVTQQSVQIKVRFEAGHPHMTPERLASLALALHGTFGWKSALARDFSVHRSTVLRWADGGIPIPPEVGVKLERLAAERAASITQLLTA